MEAVFMIWMFTCFIGSSIFYIFEKLNGTSSERAGEVWNIVVKSSAMGGLIGGVMTLAIYLLLSIIEVTIGIVTVQGIIDYVGKTGLVVFFFSNVSVASAYLAIGDKVR